MRLCRKLGCGGYKEFQRSLVFELTALTEHQDATLDDITNADSTTQVIEKIFRGDALSLEATRRLIDAKTLEKCAELIDTCRIVNIFGIGASLLAALDFEMKLSRVDKECRVHQDSHNQLLCARNLDPNDLAVVISYSGFTEEMIACARYAQARGATVIAITRVGNDAGLARHADYVLGIAASEPLVRSGAMGSRMSQLFIVDALYAVYVTRDYERCSSIILRNYTVKEDPMGRKQAVWKGEQ